MLAKQRRWSLTSRQTGQLLGLFTQTGSRKSLGVQIIWNMLKIMIMIVMIMIINGNNNDEDNKDEIKLIPAIFPIILAKIPQSKFHESCQSTWKDATRNS